MYTSSQTYVPKILHDSQALYSVSSASALPVSLYDQALIISCQSLFHLGSTGESNPFHSTYFEALPAFPSAKLPTFTGRPDLTGRDRA